MSKQILIVDDDSLVRSSLTFSLEKAGYTAFAAASAEDALAFVETRSPDLILLDIGLPGMDGLEALRSFQRASRAAVIFVTARRRQLDEIVGLELGADDYITKPFDNDVLLAHIRAVLRRAEERQSDGQEKAITVGDLVINPATHEVHIGQQEVELPPREFDLLHVLAQKAGHVFSVDDLLTRVWGPEWIGESQTVYVHIRWLREKIETDPTQPRRLLTVRGTGYKLVPFQK